MQKLFHADMTLHNNFFNRFDKKDAELYHYKYFSQNNLNNSYRITSYLIKSYINLFQ